MYKIIICTYPITHASLSQDLPNQKLIGVADWEIV